MSGGGKGPFKGEGEGAISAADLTSTPKREGGKEKSRSDNEGGGGRGGGKQHQRGRDTEGFNFFMCTFVGKKHLCVSKRM